MNIKQFSKGDLIIFKYYAFDHVSGKMVTSQKEAEIKTICISPMPHIPHKLCVEIPEGAFGIRLEEVIQHMPKSRPQLELLF
jgi:hypothetical protein